jgi:hypothetical protein
MSNAAVLAGQDVDVRDIPERSFEPLLEAPEGELYPHARADAGEREEVITTGKGEPQTHAGKTPFIGRSTKGFTAKSMSDLLSMGVVIMGGAEAPAHATSPTSPTHRSLVALR